MPNIAVFNMAGKEVAKIDLADAVFGIEPNKAVLHMAVCQLLGKPAPGYTIHSDPYRSSRWWSENLETKRNRPCSSGIYPLLHNGHTAA